MTFIVHYNPNLEVMIAEALPSIEERIFQIGQILQIKLDTKEIRFETPLLIKSTPHHMVLQCTAISTDDLSKVWARDEIGNYHELKPNQIYIELVVNSILQRLKLIMNERGIENL